MVTSVPALRRLPLPASEPPYDDEAGPAHPPRRRDSDRTQGALALSFVLPGGVPATPQLRAPLRLIGEVNPPHSVLPDPRRWCAKLAQAVLESLYGPRPLQQLLRWTDERVYRSLAQRASDRPGRVPTVRAVRLCRPSESVAEAGVVIQTGHRVRSAAVRIEAREARWLCTAFELI
ncbi:MAG TPA: Rv3235 family protein [Jiangellaceae bacterium]